MESRRKRALVVVGLMSGMMGCGGWNEDESGKAAHEGIASQALFGTFPNCPADLALSAGSTGVVDITVPDGSLHLKAWNQRAVEIDPVRCGYVVPFPATIRIFRADGDTPRILPGSGNLVTTCYGNLSSCQFIDSASWTTRQYIATATDEFGTRTSIPATVEWGVWGSLRLDVSASTAPLGTSVTITATEDYDVGPSPYYIRIFDTTTGSQLAVCGSGKSCSAAANFGMATTHKYAAYLTAYNATFPVTGAVRATPERTVKWLATGFQVTLAPQGDQIGAMTSREVGPAH